MRTTDIVNSYRELSDLITAISNETLLTPSTANEILTRSGRIGDFLNNPEAFMEKATEIIKNNRHSLAIDGISYIKPDGQEYYVQEIFDTERNFLVTSLPKRFLIKPLKITTTYRRRTPSIFRFFAKQK